MIDLSHQHARRLLRKELDAPLLEGQWSALQLHLERCAECRDYRKHLIGTEKNIRRALRSGWEPVPHPVGLDGADIASVYRARQRARVRGKTAASVLVALLVFFGLGGLGWLRGLFQPDASQTAQVPVQEPAQSATPAPTARPGDFPAIVAYEDRSAGNSDIFLLNSGAEPVNLTEDPAEDTAPAWSPDGEWLAFLSNRADASLPGFIGGVNEAPKVEVFVMDLTGKRVIQLTSQPGVRWEGPLAWSPDGQYLAVAGIREEEGGQRWIYRVNLDGSGATPLPGTRGGSAPKIARLGGRLAFYAAGDGQAGITVYDVESGARSSTTWPENALAPQLYPSAAFDWSVDGGSLAYIAAVPLEQAGIIPGTGGIGQGAGSFSGAAVGAGEIVFASQVMAVRDLRSSSTGFFENQPPLRVAASRWPSAFRSVSWTAGRHVVYLEDLGDARARPDASLSPECWRIQVAPGRRSSEGDRRSFQVGGLCVEGSFDRGSWTADGGWMVVRGRLPGERQAGLYAVRMSGRYPAERSQTGTAGDGLPVLGSLVRLLEYVDAPVEALPRVRPRLLPGEGPLEINPRPVEAAETLPPVSDLSRGADGPEGQLVYVVQNGGMSVVVTTNPDGTGGRVLYASTERNRCPRWSPDGRQVALISQNERGREGLYRIDLTRQGTSRLDLIYEDLPQPSRSFEPSGPRFGCPVWSPDYGGRGAYLAATITRGSEHYLAVFDPQVTPGEAGAVALAYLPGKPAAAGLPRSEPVWSHDLREVYLPLAPENGRPSRVAVVSLPEAGEDGLPAGLEAQLLVAKSDWGDVRGLAALPNAPYLMLAAVEVGSGDLARFSLLQVSVANGGRLPPGKLAPRDLGYAYPGAAASNSLVWLPGEQYGLVLPGDIQNGQPSIVAQYHMMTRALKELALVEDALYQVAWSPDGNWLVYTTEAGLYGLDARAASEGRARPVWLSPVVVEDIDWRD